MGNYIVPLRSKSATHGCSKDNCEFSIPVLHPPRPGAFFVAFFRYLFALFCGLVPLSLPGLWVDDAHVERKKLGAGYPRTVTAPPSPAPRALLAELVEDEQGQGSERTSSSPAAAHQLKLVSQTAAPAPVSPTGIQRKVHFAPFSGPALG